MLEVVGISAFKMAKRKKRNPNFLNKRNDFAEAMKAIGGRKVEKSAEAPMAETEQKQGAHKLDCGIVYELYDKEGKVSLRVPPKSGPVDEIA